MLTARRAPRSRCRHPQRDPLTGELEPDVDLGASQAHQADGIDHPLDLDRGAGAGR